MSDTQTIGIDQLRVGMYVRLDLRWFEHPFALSHFKIKSADQIETIRGLGLKNVRYDPALSEPSPSEGSSAEAIAPAPPRPTTSPPGITPAISKALAAKREMIERIRLQREVATQVEGAFINSALAVQNIEKNLVNKPEESIQQAQQLVDEIADSLLGATELAIHVMSDKPGGQALYFHSLNVTTLSLILARELGLPRELTSPLGMGALFHDIGMKEISSAILCKREPLTSEEQYQLEKHCEYGVSIAQRLQLPPQVLSIIADHHEYHDGSGYPRQLKGESIGLLSRIVNVANHYDGLCNPPNIANALTPHEALSLMFSRQRNKFEPRMLQLFIHCLGVYPPGTIVELSNGSIGMVATVNPEKPMKPLVVVYDAGIPKDEAMLINLADESAMSITKAIRPAIVPQAIFNYLSPRQRVSYYFDAHQPDQAKD